MAVLSTTDYSGPYTPDGVTTVFPFGFTALSASEVAALRLADDGTATILSNFSVQIDSNGGGSITFVAAPASGDPLYIVSDPSFEQQTQFGSQGSMSPKALQQAFDRAATRDLALAAAISRAPLAPPTETVGVLPTAAIRAGNFMAFDGDGNAVVASGTGADAGLRTDLAASSGAALVGLLASASSGTVARSLQQFSRDLALHPESKGAVGDGVADDTAAISAVITAAAAEGRWVDGHGKTYGVSGKISAVDNLWLRNITFKQLAPGASASVITLEADSKTNVRLRTVKVDRNGNGTNGGFAQSAGTNGCLDTAYGIRINATTRSTYEELEVTGADTGTGIWWSNLDGSNLIYSPHVHDLTGVNPIATDDNIAGMRFAFCKGLTVNAPVSRNHSMTYNGGASTDHQYTRGISYEGCEYVTVLAAQIALVDEAHDVSSSDTNIGVQIIGGSVSDCYHWGVKFANLAKRCRAIGVEAVRCGGAGFIDSSSFDAAGKIIDANLVDSCTARDCGDPSVSSLCAGFLATNGTHTYPNGVVFRNCVAVDERASPLMRYGFNNQKTASATCLASFPNSQSYGHTIAPYNGEHEDRCHVTVNVTAPSIPNNALTALTFDTEVADSAAMHDLVTAPDRVTIRKDGVYLIWGEVQWTGNATGSRELHVTKNGAVLTGALSIANGQAANHTQAVTWASVRLKAGDTLGLSVLQTSGGALNVIANSNGTGLLVQRLTS